MRMGRAAPSPPPIDAVARDERPFWSVMIPTYQGGSLLEPTLSSVLAQDPGPAEMQIEVLDDCSTEDRPEPVVERLAGDRVQVYRQPQNVGISRNFTSCIERSVGEWVHILHGDDMVHEGFYEQVRRSIGQAGRAGAVIVGCDVVDGAGAVIESPEPLLPEAGLLDEAFVRRLYRENPIKTPTIVVRRSVYEAIGGFMPSLRHCADWDMWKRILATTPTWFEPRTLALYRAHEGADTVQAYASGHNVRDAVSSVEIARSYLDPRRSAVYTREGFAAMRRWAWSLARVEGDRMGVATRGLYLRMAARCVAGEAAEIARGRAARRFAPSAGPAE